MTATLKCALATAVAAAGLAAAGLGCGSSVEIDGTGGQATATGSGTGGAAGTGGSGGSTTTTCAELSSAIADELYGPEACTTVVRLDYQSLDIVGFQILCGAYVSTNESTARTVAQSDTGYGQAGQLLSGPDPVADQYVFFEAPGDFGGVGVVSAISGLSVFGGSIIWMGPGDITWPMTWRPAVELGPDCTPETNALPPQGRGFDLESANALSPSEVDDALTQAWVSALADAMAMSSYPLDAMVLVYPRSVGALDPATAEWIVLLNSMWYE